MKKISIAIFALLVAASSFANDFEEKMAQNWHQWRGPQANGVAPIGNPPILWSASKNIKWKAKIPGVGCSTPIVWDNKIFILSAIETDKTAPSPASGEQPSSNRTNRGPEGSKPTNIYQFNVYCYDRQTGNILWEKTAVETVPHEGAHDTGTFASASPVTDGQLLYASFGSRGIFCYDLDGNLKWSRDPGDMQIVMSFGEGSSPALHKDSLIVPWDHEGQSFIANLDTKTGEPKWKTDRDEPSSWSTPLIVERNGKTQIIMNGTNRVRSYDLETGEPLWECGGQTKNVIPSPVDAGSFAICTSGFRGTALYALPYDLTGDLTGTKKILWSYNKNTPYVPSPLLYDNLLYFTKTNSAVLTILDIKTGQPVLENTRLPDMMGTLYASPAGASGKIYFLTRDGKALVIKHGEQIEVLATNQLDDEFNASPAIAGNQIFLRGKNNLYCIQEG